VVLRPGVLVLVLAVAAAAQESRRVRVEKSGDRTLRIDDSKAKFLIEVRDGLETDPDFGSPPESRPPRFHGIHPTFAAARKASRWMIPSVAEIDAVSSELDDRILATLALALQQGVPGQFIGRDKLLDRLEARSCEANPEGEACAFLGAARDLGRAESRPRKVTPAVQAVKDAFLLKATPPLGFYSASPELGAIFQQARFLQQPLPASSPVMQVVRRALDEDRSLADEYRLLNALSATITSWFAIPDVLNPTGNDHEVAIFPASRSPDGDFIQAVWGARSVPADVAMLRQITEAFADGRVNLLPLDRAGWYDHRLYGLEPLVRYEVASERRKLKRGPGYEVVCQETFVGLLTRRREAHVKDLPPPKAGSGMPRDVIFVQPAFRVEPQPTLYRRTADAYAWIRQRLAEVAGRRIFDRALSGSPAPGFDARTLGEALAAGEALYRSLAALSWSDLGLGPEPSGAGSRPAAGPPELDPRVIVPIAYDVEKKKFRCAALIGVRVIEGHVSYQTAPAVSVTTAAGAPARLKPGELSIDFFQPIALAIPVVEEVWLTTPLTREAFRKLCDEHRTHDKIRGALSKLP
jgi:hypothetical protein